MKIIGSPIAILITLLIPFHATDAQRRESNAVEPTEVMRQVVAAYHSFLTYIDRGTAIVRPAGSDEVYKVEFETLFKRPNKLRFAWTTESSSTPGYKQTGVVWCDGVAVWASYSVHGSKPEQKKSLEAAVASATGASWGLRRPSSDCCRTSFMKSFVWMNGKDSR